MRVAFVNVGGVNIEFVEDLSDSGMISRFIKEKGVGVHHIAFRVDDVKKAIIELKEKGVPLLDEVPRKGAHNSKVMLELAKIWEFNLEITCLSQER